MAIVFRQPAAPLVPFVAALWHFEAGDGELPHARERILPTGAMQLLVNLHEDELRSYHGQELRRTAGAALCGPYTGHFAIDTAEQRSIMGVSFHPGGAAPFFATPADGLREIDVEIDRLWGRDGAVLRERLLEQPTPAARLRTLEAILLARVVRPLAPDPALTLAISALERGTPVAAVAARLGWSARRLIAGFDAQVGLTPKRFARVRRFQRVLTAITSGAATPWAELALACGYFDQAHLIHDFNAFSGLHPTAYAPRTSSGQNHVVLPD